MEDSRSRGGGAAAAVSEQSAPGKPAYADVFGDPFAARRDDYAEIFGDLAGSCSIPFLDLPPALDGCDAAPVRSRGAGFDYSDVFGGLDSGEPASSYEELFAAPKREETRSSNGRTTEEAICSQKVTEEPKLSPRNSHEGRMACQEGDRFSSNSSPSDIFSTQFNVSYNKTSQGSKEGAMSGKTHITQLHAIPAFSSVVDADTSIQTIGGDGPLNILNNGIDIWKQRNKFPATSSIESSKGSENYLRADQKHSTNKSAVSGNGHANASHHSRSSSSSISSGDVFSSDTTYLTVSDISLRTRPLRVPPPSRPPSSLFDKHGHSKPRILSSPKIGLDELSLSKPVANEKEFHARQEVVKDNSPSFFDVQVDVSSAAAVSAAAIKEAMELAQAKLRSAKELMEKKHDSIQKSKKLGHHESIKYKEQKLGQASLGRESFDEKVVASEKRNEVTSAAKLSPHYKEKDKVTEEEGQARQGNDPKSSKLQSKSADKSEKWKTNKKYHELLNGEKYKMMEDVSEREDSMKKTKMMTMISEVKQNESANDSLACDMESNRKSRKDNVAPVGFVHENANLEAHDSHLEEVEKPGEVHKLHIQEEVRRAPDAGEKALSFTGNEKKMEPSDHCKLRYTHDDKRENSKLEAAVEAWEGENSFKFVEVNESKEEKEKSETDKPQGEDYEKEINVANVAPEPSKSGEKWNMSSATAAQEETEILVPRGSCISKGEGTEAACKCTDSEKTRREEKQCDAENVNQLEGTMAVHEHMKQQSCLSAENELRLKADQEADKLEEDLKKWKSSAGATSLEGQEKLVKATKAACWQDFNGYNAKQDQLELQQRDKKEDAAPEPYNLENFEGQNKYEKGLGVCGNEGFIEIQVEPYFMDKIISMNAVPVICRRPLNTTLVVQPDNLSEKEGAISFLSLVAMESQPVASQNIILDIKKTEEKEKDIMEEKREQMKKMARKLEEVKEKERIQEEEQEKTKLLEEDNERERKLVEEKERARLWEEVKDRERKLEAEKEQARSLEEAKERERKLKEEKERVRLLEEAKKKKRKLEEEERARLLKEAKERERKVEEEQARLLEETKERERKLEEENDRARLLEEAKERERKQEEEERASLLEEAKERERKLEEEKDRARLLEEAKERERKLEEEKERARLLEEAKERERRLEEEKQRARLLEEEKERERERAKDRLAVERATREARERAFAEARERAEKLAVERVTSEAWQRALREAQEKAEKASCEALEKSLTEKASREARLRAERAAVERATAEAREHAVERALAEKAAADARERSERYNATSRDRTRKENVTKEHLNTKDKDSSRDAQFQSTGCLSGYQPNSDSTEQRKNFGEGESALRCKARLERHQRIAERAAKALAEKNMRDILGQREQAGRNRLAEYLDADIKRWSNGKEGNLRALLSTLQYVLGPESGWQPIPLTDVVTASAVKKAYRKATLCVHPDKLQQRGASIQQKYICDKVFDLLKEAWNRFNSEER